MKELKFVGFPKISRLNCEIVITEKIDGTNGAIGVTDDGQVYAQSRTRILTPEQDNFGLAKWVRDNAEQLKETLGLGLHFGEWWGKGIQRGYGLTNHRFSLFNTERWKPEEVDSAGLYVVPVLYQGEWMCYDNDDAAFMPEIQLDELRVYGSKAAPGFMKPEGIVIYHKASRTLFKATIEKDEEPKNVRTKSER